MPNFKVLNTPSRQNEHRTYPITKVQLQLMKTSMQHTQTLTGIWLNTQFPNICPAGISQSSLFGQYFNNSNYT